jgi:hypothetical protein
MTRTVTQAPSPDSSARSPATTLQNATGYVRGV